MRKPLGRVLVGVAVVVGAVLVWLRPWEVWQRPGDGPGPEDRSGPSEGPPAMWSAVGADPAAYAARMVAETNAARDAEGLPALGTSSCARDAAAERADALLGLADLEHAPLTGVIETCGVGVAAENLSRAQADAADVVDAWLHSPGHRANLLDPQLTEVGVACAADGHAMVCSQVFLGS